LQYRVNIFCRVFRLLTNLIVRYNNLELEEKEGQLIVAEKTKIPVTSVSSDESEKLLNRLAPWKNLPFALSSIRNYDNFAVEMIRSTQKDYATLTDAVTARVPAAFTDALNGDEKTIYGIIVYHLSVAEEIDDILKEHGAVREDFAGLTDKPATHVETIKTKQQELIRQENKLRVSAAELAEHRAELQLLYDEEVNRRDRREVQNDFVGTATVLTFSGWLQQEKEEALLQTLSAEFPTVHIELRDPAPGETPPVALRNSGAFSPMELVTELYGLPNDCEDDPSPLLGPFFALFFALCIGDAGYSIVLMLASFLLQKVFKTSRLLSLMKQCGFVGIIVGAAMGGWFGIEYNDLHGYLQALVLLPANDIMLFMKVALILGMVHLGFGIIISIRRACRRGDYGIAVFERLPWFVVLLSVMILGFVTVPALQMAAKYAFFLAFMTLLLFKNRTAPIKPTLDIPLWLVMLCGSSFYFGAKWFGLFPETFIAVGKYIMGGWLVLLLLLYRTKSLQALGRIGAGLYELYQSSGYLGDVLSYLRLMALGLSSGILAMVVNVIAGIVATLIPVVGWLLALIILVLGHAANLALAALGGFIHTARLQFVEFYPEFFEGGGTAFTPFKQEVKYTKIED